MCRPYRDLFSPHRAASYVGFGRFDEQDPVEIALGSGLAASKRAEKDYTSIFCKRPSVLRQQQGLQIAKFPFGVRKNGIEPFDDLIGEVMSQEPLSVGSTRVLDHR